MVRLFLALLIGITLAAPAFTQDGGPFLRRGVNVHEWLNWSPLDDSGGYRWPPYRSIEDWLSGGRPLSDWPEGDQFARIREMGFDFVRLSVDPGPLLASQGAKRQEALDVIRAAAGQVVGAGLAVVLDLHAVGQKPEYSLAGLDNDADSEGTRRYRAMVADVAGMLATFDTASVALEPFNEPGFYPCGAGGSGEWQKIIGATIADIRAVSADLTIIATGACGGSVAGLVDLDPSFDDPNIRYSFHMYEPHSFTHQRADDPGGFVSGLPWPAAAGSLSTSSAELKAHMQADGVDPMTQTLNLAAFHTIAADYFTADAGPAQLNALFDKAMRWAGENNIPTERLFMGEFGAILMTPDGRMGAHNADRLRYLTAVRKQAEHFGVPWSIWEYSNPYGMSLILPSGPAEADPDLLRALGLGAGLAQ